MEKKMGNDFSVECTEAITKFIESLPDQNLTTIIIYLETLKNEVDVELKKIRQTKVNEVRDEIVRIIRDNGVRLAVYNAGLYVRMKNTETSPEALIPWS